MEIYNDINKINEETPTAIALGAFDGLHKGHIEVIKSAVKSQSGQAAVFTFEENPHGAKQLILPHDKQAILKNMGVKKLFCIPFEQIKTMQAKAFLQNVLVKKCNASAVFCGQDFRFGKGAEGGAELLKAFCGLHKIKLNILTDVNFDKERISSTRIRTALENGDIASANKMLGRLFGYSIVVEKGKQLGRTIGVPTFNQTLPVGFIQPRLGVYASISKINGRYLPSVTNIGVKPTVGSDRVISETWVPNFEGNLYGKDIWVEIAGFIREEKKFASLEELKKVIVNDEMKAKEITQNLGY